MGSKFTTIRLVLSGEHFEILVNPNAALNYKQGKPVEVSQVLVSDEVFSESSKGLRISSEKLKKFFNTTSSLEAAKMILKKGDLQLTTEQRKGLIEDKRKQIISLISKNFVDPKTSLPHPPLRIEHAMEEVRVSIDPFRSSEEQAKQIVEQLRPIIPLKSEKINLMIKVPADFAPKVIGTLKSYGEIKKEEWLPNGSLNVVLEIPAGVQLALIDKVGSVTKGSSQITKVS